jgi:hypothetical protein
LDSESELGMGTLMLMVIISVAIISNKNDKAPSKSGLEVNSVLMPSISADCT